MQTHNDTWSLTEREKQTLRLIVRGHDAKSIARTLDLSVHTINERLRDARRKMAVSSSREAARLLLDAEGDRATPDSFGDKGIREDVDRAEVDREAAPDVGAGTGDRRPLTILVGVLLMTLSLGLLALAILTPGPATQPAPSASRSAAEQAVIESAQIFLALVDQEKWDESYQATGSAFQKLNTPQVWAQVSQKVRVPLGAMLSRTFISHQELPARPAGYDVVKFRTRYANKPEAVETVTLDREAGAWRVVGVMIE